MNIVSKVVGKAKYETVMFLRKLSGLIDGLAYHIEAAKILSGQEREILKRNERFALCHKGKRAFVIGNGPSLNVQDLSLLKNEITFTCNAFYLHPILSQWQPTYHSHIDPAAFGGSIDMVPWFSEVCRKMPNTMFFLPINGRDMNSKKNLFPDDRTYYCDFAGKLANDVKSVDITKPIPGAESVSLFGLCLAVYMGCNPIYLIGMDHDFLAARRPSAHFYNEMVVRGAIVGSDISKAPYDSIMHDLIRFWDGYRNLKKFAESRGTKIYNATNGGFLDVFERVRYESIFVGDKTSSASSLKVLSKV